MKRNFRLFVFTPLQILFFSLRTSVFVTGFIFIFSLCLFLPNLNATTDLSFPNPDVTISMDLQDTSLKDILKILSMQSGLNFIASEAVQERTVTLYLDKVPIKQAMDKLFKANNLSYELERDSNVIIVKDWGKPQIETETRVFYLKYATVSTSSLKEEMANQIIAQTTTGGATGGGGGGGEKGKWAVEEDSGITKAVKKLLSEHGSVIEDYRTNSLIITDVPSRMPIIAKIIAALDVRIPQVMLEVEMLDVSKNVVDKMGFDFTSAASFAVKAVSASRPISFPIRAFSPEESTKGAFTFGTLSFPTDLKLVFDFLRTRTDTKILARPRLLTLNNETAEISITKDEVVTKKKVWISNTGESGGGHWEDQFERATSLKLTPNGIGISLRVTPQINIETGEITMYIHPESSSATQSPYVTDQVALDPEIKSTKSIVKVKDGETVILGGLIHIDKTVIVKKLPILGDIPFLGALFRHKNQSKDIERELLVFITPHIVKDIVKDTNVELAQTKKVGFPEREQNTTSGIDRQATINASLNSFEKKKK